MITNHEFVNLEVGDWIYFEHSYVEYSYGEIIKVNDNETVEANDSHYNYILTIDKILEVRKMPLWRNRQTQFNTREW